MQYSFERLVIFVWALRRVNMHHHIEHAVPLEHARSGFYGDVVPGFNGLRGFNFEVYIDNN